LEVHGIFLKDSKTFDTDNSHTFNPFSWTDRCE